MSKRPQKKLTRDERIRIRERSRCVKILNEAIEQARGKAWFHPEITLQALVDAITAGESG